MKYFLINGVVYTAFNEIETNFNHYDIIREINFNENFICIEEYGGDKVTRYKLFDEIHLTNTSQDFKTLENSVVPLTESEIESLRKSKQDALIELKNLSNGE